MVCCNLLLSDLPWQAEWVTITKGSNSAWSLGLLSSQHALINVLFSGLILASGYDCGYDVMSMTYACSISLLLLFIYMSNELQVHYYD